MAQEVRVMPDFKVFISYGGSDPLWVERFRRCLAWRGVDSWLPPVPFPYGDDAGREAVKRAMRESDALVVLVTHEGVEHPALYVEIGAAVGLNKPIIAVVPSDFDEALLPRFTRSAPHVIRQTPEQTAEALVMLKAA